MMVRAGTNFQYQPTEAHGAASSSPRQNLPSDTTERRGGLGHARPFMDADHLGGERLRFLGG
jgi:hypothetical protein